MADPSSTFWWILSVPLAGLAILGAVVYYKRRSFLQAITERSKEAKRSTLGRFRRLAQICRALLLLSPLYLVLLPFALHAYLQLNLAPFITMLVLLFANVLEIYLYSRWLVRSIGADLDSSANSVV